MVKLEGSSCQYPMLVCWGFFIFNPCQARWWVADWGLVWSFYAFLAFSSGLFSICQMKCRWLICLVFQVISITAFFYPPIRILSTLQPASINATINKKTASFLQSFSTNLHTHKSNIYWSFLDILLHKILLLWFICGIKWEWK